MPVKRPVGRCIPEFCDNRIVVWPKMEHESHVNQPAGLNMDLLGRMLKALERKLLTTEQDGNGKNKKRGSKKLA